MLKASLPNEWSYELAEEVVRDYVQRIFVKVCVRIGQFMTAETTKDSLAKYPELKERMQSLLEQGEKITPKQWKAEMQSLQAEYDSIGKEQSKTATKLAYAEVISYNKKNLERELQNKSRQHNRQQGRVKWREEEI